MRREAYWNRYVMEPYLALSICLVFIEKNRNSPFISLNIQGNCKFEEVA